MDRRIKQLWVEALRSSNYAKCKSIVHKKNAFCCLGVLIDLYVKEHGITWADIDGSYAMLPDKVKNWAGLPSWDPVIQMYPERTANMCNDELNMSFAEIADLIEENLW
jgi:hypothetical protein